MKMPNTDIKTEATTMIYKSWTLMMMNRTIKKIVFDQQELLVDGGDFEINEIQI